MQFKITNFTGNLTRKKFGDMNSGLARWGKSHSISPFQDPEALEFNETATNLDPSHATVADVIMGFVPNVESGTLYNYAVDRSGNVYKINTSTDSISVISSSLAITLKYGGGIGIISPGGVNKLIIGHDTGALTLNLDGTNRTDIVNVTALTVQDTDFNFSTSVLSINATDVTSGGSVVDEWYTGQAVKFPGGTGSLPSPLVYGTTYYLIVLTASTTSGAGTVQLATSPANALAGTFITLTDNSGGPFTFTTINNWVANIPRPISQEFFGAIFIGNGYMMADYAIGLGILSHPSRLSPTFPKNYTINSLEVDGEGRYMRIAGTTGTAVDIATQDPATLSQAPIARTLYWNGSDVAYDSMDPFSQTSTAGSFSFLGADYAFGQDFFGNALYTNSGGSMDKISATHYVRPSQQSAITSTSDLMIFGAPYLVQGSWLAGIFGFGVLDDADQPGIYPFLGISPTSNNTICTAVGAISLVQNRVLKSDGTTLTYSKFYVSTYETGGTAKGNIYSFSLTPGGGTPNGGVYQSQTQRFTLPQTIDRVLILQEVSASGVSYKVELVDVDDTIPTGASFTYTYAGGSDDTLLQGALEQVPWENMGIKNMQGLGVKITNLGTVQPNILGVFIDTHDTDKSATPS